MPRSRNSRDAVATAGTSPRALLGACNTGNRALVDELLAHDDTAVLQRWLNERDDIGLTALHVAIIHFAPSSAPSDTESIRDMVRIRSMIEARANIEAAAKRPQGWTPLACAAETGNTPVLKLLLASGAVASGYPAAFIAAQLGELPCLAELLRSGADVDTYERPKEGDATGSRTLLMMAANNGHESVVDHILESGASADLRSTGEGATALFFAAQGGHEGCVRRLLTARADTDIGKRPGGQTPLFIAAKNGHVGAVQALCEGGADTEAARVDGMTPLYVATTVAQVEVVRALLAAGADPHVEVEAQPGGGCGSALFYAQTVGPNMTAAQRRASVHPQDRHLVPSPDELKPRYEACKRMLRAASLDDERLGEVLDEWLEAMAAPGPPTLNYSLREIEAGRATTEELTAAMDLMGEMSSMRIVGKRVRLVELKATQLNGCVGLCTSYEGEGGRMVVVLDAPPHNRARTVRVQPAHVESAEAEEVDERGMVRDRSKLPPPLLGPEGFRSALSMESIGPDGEKGASPALAKAGKAAEQKPSPAGVTVTADAMAALSLGSVGGGAREGYEEEEAEEAEEEEEHDAETNAVAERLGRAAQLGEVERLTSMLSSGVDPNLPEWIDGLFGGPRQRSYALVNAAACGHSTCVRLLLAYGADPDPAGSRHSMLGPPITAATATCKPGVMAMLLHARASADGEALGFMMYEGGLGKTSPDDRELCARLLLAAGADPNSHGDPKARRTDFEGKTPLQMARKVA